MKKHSLNTRQIFDNGVTQEAIRANPKPFRHVQSAIALVMEMAVTGRFSESLAPLVGGWQQVLRLELVELTDAFKCASRMTTEMFSGILQECCMGARIRFFNKDDKNILEITVCADSDGIRLIHRAY